MALLTYTEFTDLYSSSLTQAQVEGFIAVVQAEIERYCNRLPLTPSGTGGFESASRTVVFSGNGQPGVILPYAPISAVTSIAITQGGGTTTYTGSDVTSNFAWDTTEVGELKWKDASYGRFGVDEWGEQMQPGWGHTPCFPEGHQNVSIVFTAGYSTVPADLKQIVREMTLERIQQRGAGKGQDFDKQSENLGRYSYTRFGPDAGGGADWTRRWGTRLAYYRREVLV